MVESQIISPSGRIYKVIKLIGKNSRFNLYECIVSEKEVGILKIAASIAENGALDREAYILGIMRDEAKACEEEYALIKKSEKLLNYQMYFPDLVDSFVSKEQNKRSVNVLSFSPISENLSQLTPLSHLAARDHVRVDPRTSAWILGKLLKMLVFTHSQGIFINSLTRENILINREQHYVAVFDWSKVTISEKGSVENSAKRDEISQIARNVIAILGGNTETGELLLGEQSSDSRYADFLKQLLRGNESDASEAHQKFYELIRSLWPREFYPFTTYRII